MQVKLMEIEIKKTSKRKRLLEVEGQNKEKDGRKEKLFMHCQYCSTMTPTATIEKEKERERDHRILGEENPQWVRAEICLHSCHGGGRTEWEWQGKERKRAKKIESLKERVRVIWWKLFKALSTAFSPAGRSRIHIHSCRSRHVIDIHVNPRLTLLCIHLNVLNRCFFLVVFLWLDFSAAPICILSLVTWKAGK